MKWTDKLPTQPGFYWVRDFPFDGNNIVEVVEGDSPEGKFLSLRGFGGIFGKSWQDGFNDWSDQPIALPSDGPKPLGEILTPEEDFTVTS
jgi:hypothetical protein